LLYLALLAWALASPVGASPDDDFHLISTWCSGSDESECQAGADETTRVVPLALLASACYAFDEEQSAACQGDLMDSENRPSVESPRGNFEGTYPPLYYATVGLFASADIEPSVLGIRAFNAALLVVLGSVAALVLPARRRAAMTLSWLVTSVPLTVFIIASNNPSSWAFAGSAVAWITWWSYFESQGRVRITAGAVATIASVVSIGARADAAVYVSLGIGCAALLSWKHLRKTPRVALIPPLAVIVFGAFVFLSSGQASAVDGLSEEGTSAHGGVTLLANNILQLPSLWTGGFGTWGLGWLDTAMPPLVLWSTAGVCIGVLFVGLRGIERPHALAIGTVALAVVVVPLYVLQMGGDPVGANVQPRYIWPLIVLLVGLVIARPHGGILRLNRTQVWLVGLSLSGANSVALYTNMRRYVTGSDVHDPNLNADVEWWWQQAPSPMAVWVVGSLAFGAASTLLLIDYVRASRSSPQHGDVNTEMVSDEPASR
jgi:hypothetical protein